MFVHLIDSTRTVLGKGWLVSLVGLLAVFATLLMFFVLIKLLIKMYPEKENE